MEPKWEALGLISRLECLVFRKARSGGLSGSTRVRHPSKVGRPAEVPASRGASELQQRPDVDVVALVPVELVDEGVVVATEPVCPIVVSAGEVVEV